MDLKVFFISLDPDRDDTNKIRTFLDKFDKNIIGATAKANNDPKLLDLM